MWWNIFCSHDQCGHKSSHCQNPDIKNIAHQPVPLIMNERTRQWLCTTAVTWFAGVLASGNSRTRTEHREQKEEAWDQGLRHYEINIDSACRALLRCLTAHKQSSLHVESYCQTSFFSTIVVGSNVQYSHFLQPVIWHNLLAATFLEVGWHGIDSLGYDKRIYFMKKCLFHCSCRLNCIYLIDTIFA